MPLVHCPCGTHCAPAPPLTVPLLQDEAISVREAAVTLLGRHVASSQALALRLFNTLARASTDAGTSVRKAAIKILWESCIRVPGFSRATGEGRAAYGSSLGLQGKEDVGDMRVESNKSRAVWDVSALTNMSGCLAGRQAHRDTCSVLPPYVSDCPSMAIPTPFLHPCAQPHRARQMLASTC